jgi:uncharacterized protein (TIGR03437 family)
MSQLDSAFSQMAARMAALILSFAAVALPARAAGSGCIAPPSGLVSWWPGDTNYNDIWGSNNPSDSSLVSLVPAEVLDGFSLQPNGYLEVPPSASLANQNFTWAAWVKPLGPGTNTDASAIVLQDIDDYDLSVALYWESTNSKFLFVFGAYGTEQVESTDAFPIGSFYHAAVTYDGSVFRMFVNGMAEGSYSEAKTVAYSTNPWAIGSSGQLGIQVGFPRTFDGVVDELQAFNRPLTQSELQAIYAAGTAGECKTGLSTGPPPGAATAVSVNAASYANSILPNSGIAQGSLFAIYGSNLGPSTSPGLSFPLSTTLGGVTINVYQGHQVVSAIPVFVSGSQVNAIMPSTAPVGAVSITVSYQGQNSTAPAQVVPASFGIFAANSSGSGQGIITDAAYALTGYNSPAHPGGTLIIWGTGMGAISGSDAEPPPAGNIGTTPPPVYVGGTQVTPTYYGRSGCCAGLDQIVFQVPAGVTGCNVPVAVQAGGTVGNFVSLAVAPSGSSTCTDPSGFTAAQLSKMTAQDSGSIGSIFYDVYNDISPGINVFGGGSTETSTGTQELATFAKYQFINVDNFAQVLNPGACTVYTFTGASLTGAGVLGSVGLDAGSSITVTDGGAQGKIPGSSTSTGVYSDHYELPNGSATFTGSGGTSVGPFTVTIPLTTQSLNWTNEGAISSITRASGVNVTWSGGDADGTVQITGFSIGGTSTSSAAGAGFSCTAPAGAGQFTVPAEILMALPASGSLGSSLLPIASGSLGISQLSAPVSFTATGLDIGYALSETTFSNSTVTYQ